MANLDFSDSPEAKPGHIVRSLPKTEQKGHVPHPDQSMLKGDAPSPTLFIPPICQLKQVTMESYGTSEEWDPESLTAQRKATGWTETPTGNHHMSKNKYPLFLYHSIFPGLLELLTRVYLKQMLGTYHWPNSHLLLPKSNHQVIPTKVKLDRKWHKPDEVLSSRGWPVSGRNRRPNSVRWWRWKTNSETWWFGAEELEKPSENWWHLCWPWRLKTSGESDGVGDSRPRGSREHSLTSNLTTNTFL